MNLICNLIFNIALKKQRFKNKFHNKIHGNTGMFSTNIDEVIIWGRHAIEYLLDLFWYSQSSPTQLLFLSASVKYVFNNLGHILRANQIPNAKNYTLKTSQRAITWRLRGIWVDKIRLRFWNNSIEISVRSIIYSFPTWAV